MNLRPGKRENPDVNLTPLIDVVFLLLIFFMVSTSFDRHSDISVNLPQADTEKTEATEDTVIDVTIDSNGQFYVNSKQLINAQVDTLKRAITEAAGGNSDMPLVISADAQTPHQAVVTAMDAARQLGIVHLSIATIQPKQ
jgi:biopolymer transport protein ExbD